jgi:hypothetical protein
MQEGIGVALIVGIIFYSIILFTRTLTDYFLRKRIISQGHADMAEILKVSKSEEWEIYPSLKWGLIAFFTAVALIVTEFLPYNWNESPLPFGMIILGISLGFLVYFFVMRSMKKN